ncbi:RNA polymerase sigma factor [uncultured Fibrella sp.]|uniref:RNA polymerase sigma factor n=1 Tax=uncultured Fibrella sp. TaxID=1284596 RepID=UPI0035C98A98
MNPGHSPQFIPISDWSDPELIEGIRLGNRLAFGELYERYWEELHRVASRKTGSAEGAEELVQDLFVSLWQRRETLQIDQARRYLFAALKFAIIDLIRSTATHERFVAHIEATTTHIDRRTEDELAMQDLTRSVEQGLSSLPEKTQEVFRLSRFDCLTIPEIAVRLNLSEKTVQYHLSNALRELRTYLRNE